MSVLAVGSALVLAGCNDGGAADASGEPSAGGTPAAEDVAPVGQEPDAAEGPTGGAATEDESDEGAGASAPVAAGDLTQAGATLDAGEPATVQVSTSNDASVVEVTVQTPRAGDPEDLAEHNVPDEVADHVPHYLDVSVANVGEGNLGNGNVRVRGISDAGQLVIAAVVTDLDQCDSTSFPSDFVNGDSIETCFLFMLPDGDSLVGAEFVDFDREQGDDPIRWQF